MVASVQVVRRSKLKPAKLKKGPAQVKVGFPAGQADANNIMKAIWNEFGTRGGGWGGPIPERPFMRNAMRSNLGKYQRALQQSARAIVRGEVTTTAVLTKLGIMAQGDIQSEITSLVSPPNSPVTIRRKGSSKPLIDTGAMRQSVTWKLVP